VVRVWADGVVVVVHVVAVTVLSAWSNVLAYTVRESFSGDRMVVLGYDTKSRLCEVIGLRKPYGWPLIHAMTPPTKKTVREVSGGGRLW
jgi:hypothetical protein